MVGTSGYIKQVYGSFKPTNIGGRGHHSTAMRNEKGHNMAQRVSDPMGLEQSSQWYHCGNTHRSLSGIIVEPIYLHFTQNNCETWEVPPLVLISRREKEWSPGHFAICEWTITSLSAIIPFINKYRSFRIMIDDINHIVNLRLQQHRESK